MGDAVLAKDGLGGSSALTSRAERWSNLTTRILATTFCTYQITMSTDASDRGKICQVLWDMVAVMKKQEIKMRKSSRS